MKALPLTKGGQGRTSAESLSPWRAIRRLRFLIFRLAVVALFVTAINLAVHCIK